MNTADVAELIRSLSNPSVTKLLQHPAWENVFNNLTNRISDDMNDFFDLDETVQFVHILTNYSPTVVEDNIWIDQSGTDPVMWNDEDLEWVGESNDDEDSDEDEDEYSDDEEENDED
jgi:hypothetical protein